MKKANFNFTFPGRTPGKVGRIYGSVSMNAKGRVTVSISKRERMAHLSSNIWDAQNAATRAIRNDFQLTEKEKGLKLFNVVNEAAALAQASNIEQINAALTEHTQELRIAYILHTRQRAVKVFTTARTKMAMSNDEWLKEYGITFVTRPRQVYQGGGRYGNHPTETERVPEPKYMFEIMANTRGYYERVLSFGSFKAFEEQEVKEATEHFNDGLLKLAHRLEQKGVQAASMEISSAVVGVNIEMRIKCNIGILDAWTIIAEGPIQRRHYRYLVK